MSFIILLFNKEKFDYIQEDAFCRAPVQKKKKIILIIIKSQIILHIVTFFYYKITVNQI